VFLANGQVYFGKLGATGDEYVSLTDVFYLRIQQQLQPPSEEPEVKRPVFISKSVSTNINNALEDIQKPIIKKEEPKDEDEDLEIPAFIRKKMGM